jgi:thioredoxin-like negative regulator of GroEL
MAAAAAPLPSTNAAEAWFTAIKPYCNSVEVEFQTRQNPAPQSVEGIGYSAACYALAGRLDRAQALLDGVPGTSRLQAVGIVFNVAHPVADAGDDRAAGPIMELVVHYWPNHYMALYHAGMSAYTLNQYDRAREHLQAFLKYYESDDGWRRNALDVLQRLKTAAP